jgi:hypothetical protein
VEEVKKKVLLDLFASPWTLLPLATGLSAFMLSWAGDGNVALNLVGLTGVLSSAGALATRLIYGLDSITENAYRYLHEKQQQQQQSALDALERRLASDPDPRTAESLRQLRRLYAGFVGDVESGKITGQTHRLLERVEEVFRASVEQLQLSHDLWDAAERLTGEARGAVLREREEAVQEVVRTIEHLGRTIEQFHTFQIKRSTSELERLRADLDETIRVARRTDERMAAMDRPRAYESSELET